jgi:small-conductance mechanosensitive channel
VNDLGEWLQTNLELILGPNVETKLLNTALIILGLWLLRLLALLLIDHRTDDVRLRYRWRKTLGYLTALIGVFAVGRLWLKGFQSLATFLGLASAGLAIALRDPLINLVGWAFILWRRPFEVGDRIQIGGHAGDVIDVRIFQFTLLEIRGWVAADQSTGRIVHVPNSQVFSETLTNYHKGLGYIWNEIPVLVTFESDWQKAKAILQEIARRHAAHLTQAAQESIRQAAKRFMIAYPTLTPTVYTRVEASGVLLTIRHLCEPRRRRTAEQTLWEEILRAFAQHPDINFAYPTRRFVTGRPAGAQPPVVPPERPEGPVVEPGGAP